MKKDNNLDKESQIIRLFTVIKKIRIKQLNIC